MGSSTLSMSSGGESSCLAGGIRTHKCILVPDHGAAAGGETMAAPIAQRCTVTAGRCKLPPPTDRTTVGLATEWEHSEMLGLPPAVVRTVQSVGAQSATACSTGRCLLFSASVWREAQLPCCVLWF